MKKVLCIIDIPNWAMYNRVLAFQKYLSNEYQFDYVLFDKLTFEKLQSYDIVYNLNWVLHNKIKHILEKNHGSRKYKMVTTICSHVKRNSPKDLADIMKYYDSITTSNMFLYNEFRSTYGGKVHYTPFGVDTTLFVKKNQPVRTKPFIFVGKSNRSLKRYVDIANACKTARVPLKVADHTTKYSRKQMVDFYNNGSVVICFSKSEGTPNPALEGGACGRALISSPVGNIPEIFSNGYLLKPVRSKAELLDQIRKFKTDQKLLDECSRYMHQEINNNWSWEVRTKGFIGAL